MFLNIHFLGNFYLKLNQLKNGILLMNTNKVARAFSSRSKQVFLFFKKQ